MSVDRKRALVLTIEEIDTLLHWYSWADSEGATDERDDELADDLRRLRDKWSRLEERA